MSSDAIHYGTLEGIDINSITANGGKSAVSINSGNGGAGTVFFNDKNNPQNKQMRIVGSGSGSEYADASSLDTIDSTIPLVIKNANILFNRNIASSVSFDHSTVNVLSGVTSSGPINVSASYVSIAGNSTLIGALSVDKGSELIFRNSTTIQGAISLIDSRMTFEQPSSVVNLYLVSSVLEFYDSAFENGTADLVNSHVSVRGDLEANSAVNLSVESTNVAIQLFSYNLAAPYLSTDSQTKVITEDSSQAEKDSIQKEFRLV